jgi:aspartyl protease family protein
MLRICLVVLWTAMVLARPMGATEAAAAASRITARALFDGKAMLEIDGRQRLLNVGQRSPEGVLLIAATPASAQVDIAGTRHEIALDSSIGASFSPVAAPRSLLLSPAGDGHYYVDGAINGTAIRFAIDTGASTIAINRQDARRIGLLYRVDGEPTLVETASGRARAYRVRFKSVKARTIEQKEIEGIVIDGDYPSTALLGQSFLNRLDMTREGVMMELRER